MLLKLILFNAFVFSQEMGVQVDKIDANSDTTISIKKGVEPSKSLFQITESEDDIEGESAPLVKEARKNWKAACSEWKIETKDLNKDNKIISLNCGTMKCTTSTMETVCNSKAKHKIRIKIAE